MHPLLLIRKWQTRLECAGISQTELRVMTTYADSVVSEDIVTVATEHLGAWCAQQIQEVEQKQSTATKEDREQITQINCVLVDPQAIAVIESQIGPGYMTVVFRFEITPTIGCVVGFFHHVDRHGVVRPLVEMEDIDSQNKINVRVSDYFQLRANGFRMGSLAQVLGVSPHQTLVLLDPVSMGPMGYHPKRCGCGGYIKRTKGSRLHRCVNPFCFYRQLSIFNYATAELGLLQLKRPRLVRQLYHFGIVKSLYDLFDPGQWLNDSEMPECDFNAAMGDVRVAITELPQKWDWELVSALSIEGITPLVAKLLCKAIPYQELHKVTLEQLNAVHGLTQGQRSGLVGYFDSIGSNCYQWLWWGAGVHFRSSYCK